MKFSVFPIFTVILFSVLTCGFAGNIPGDALKGFPGKEGVAALGAASESHANDNGASKGNLVTVSRPMSLDTMSVYLEDVPSGTTIEWAVYGTEGAIESTYTKLKAVSLTVNGGAGYFSSPAIGVVLRPGWTYWLGAYWDQPVTYFYSNTIPSAPLTFELEFGDLIYHGRKGAYNTFPGPDEDDLHDFVDSAPYRFSYHLRAVEDVDLGVDSDTHSLGATCKGNTISVSEPMTLQTIGLYLTEVPADTEIYWAVYRALTGSTAFSRVWDASATVGGGDGYFDSPPVMTTLEPGYHYWIGGFWDQSAAYYYGSSSQPGAPQLWNFGFGDLTYEAREDSVISAIPGPSSFTSNGGYEGAPYRQRYVLRPGAAVTPGENDEDSNLGENVGKADCITVAESSTLEAIESYLGDVSTGTTVTFLVYSGSALTGTYTKIFESSRTVNEGDGYFSSGPVMLTLDAGVYYLIGSYWTQYARYYFSNTLPGAPLDISLGATSMTYHGRSTFGFTLPAPTTLSISSLSQSAPYQMRCIFSGSVDAVFYDDMETNDLRAWTSSTP